MNQLIIKRKTTPENIENLYLDLYQLNDAKVEIVMPKDFENYDIGLLQLLIQFLGTCLRYKKDCVLLVEISIDQKAVEEFMAQPFAYPAVILFWFKGIFTSKERTNLKAILIPFTNKTRFEMKSLTSVKSQRLLLTCFDHFTPEKGLLDCFYDDNLFIKSDAILSFTLDDSIRQVLNFNKKAAAKSIGPIIEDLIAIIYELMKNTDEWGKTDISDKPINPNVRGLQLRFLKRPKEKMIAQYHDFSGMRNYFETFDTVANGLIYFLEISVFDCGIGFIEKSTGKAMQQFELEDQVKIIKECLIKNSTSAHGLNREGKGLGLDRILRTINNKGLLWIRTSNVSLFRNLRSEPYIESKTPTEVSLFDWNNNSKTHFRHHSKAAGAVLTILYPITLTDE